MITLKELLQLNETVTLLKRYGNVNGSELDCSIVPIQLDMDCAWK